MISQGEIWRADLPKPIGSEPGYERPVLVVQCDSLNHGRIATVVCVGLTTSLHWENAPGNVRLTARSTALPKDSVANVSQIATLDKTLLTKRVGKLSKPKLEAVLEGIDIMLGR